MKTVQTVTGPVAIDALGSVLMHEHIYSSSMGVAVNYPQLYKEGSDTGSEENGTNGRHKDNRDAGNYAHESNSLECTRSIAFTLHFLQNEIENSPVYYADRKNASYQQAYSRCVRNKHYTNHLFYFLL